MAAFLVQARFVVSLLLAINVEVISCGSLKSLKIAPDFASSPDLHKKTSSPHQAHALGGEYMTLNGQLILGQQPAEGQPPKRKTSSQHRNPLASIGAPDTWDPNNLPKAHSSPEAQRAAAGSGGWIQLTGVCLCSLLIGIVVAHEIVVHFTGQLPLTGDGDVHRDRRFLQRSYLCWWVLLSMDPSLLIPTSYELSAKMGCSATMSGLLVGVGFLSSPVGSIGGAYLYKRLTQRSSRIIGVAGAFTLMLMNLIVALTLDSSDDHGPGTMWFIIFIRLFLGCGKIAYVVQFMAFNTTPKPDRTNLSVCVALATNIGLCLGPVLTAGIIHALGGREVITSVFSRTSGVIYLMACLWGCLALAFALFVPLDIKHMMLEADIIGNDALAQRSSRLTIGDRKSIVSQGIMFTIERSLASGAIEAGSAMILETQYGWGARAIGFSISAVFGTTIIVCGIIMLIRNTGLMKDVNSFVILAAISCSGALFLFDFGEHFGGGAIQILFADVMVYPFMYGANGIADGIVTRVTIPDTWFSLECYLGAKSAFMGIFRFIAFPLARHLLDIGGRNTYASMLMLLGVLGLVSSLKIAWVLDWKDAEWNFEGEKAG